MDNALVRSVDDEESTFAVLVRPAEYDESLRCQVIHERGVLRPKLLRFKRAAIVPRGTMNAWYHEQSSHVIPLA
jgi:hypothetical protein